VKSLIIATLGLVNSKSATLIFVYPYSTSSIGTYKWPR